MEQKEMDFKRLETASAQISQSVHMLREELTRKLGEYDTEIKEAQVALQKAYEMGDLRENSEFDAAVSRCGELSYSKLLMKKKLESIEAIGVEEEDYVPIGMVVMFSTVLLVNNKDKDREFIFKLYPAGVSDLDRGVLSIDSIIGRVLYMKETGAQFETSHRVTGEKRKWQIRAIY